MQYPATRHDDTVIDDYHGTLVPDPYRWLEDPNSDETGAWVAAQNEVTFGYLRDLPHRGPIAERLEQVWDYPKRGLPFRTGGRWFQYRNSGLQNQSVLYVGDAPDGEFRELLDPNALSAEGTVALGGIAVSENGAYLAYSLSSAGSDWQTWRVRDIATGTDLPDELTWSKFSGASWSHDHAGFYYSRYDAPAAGEEYSSTNLNQKLCYHRLGTPQADDVVVYERPDHPQWGFGGHVTDDGRYLVISVWNGTQQENAVFYCDLAEPGAPVVELLAAWDARWSLVDNDGERFWLFTNKDAPRSRLVAIDLSAPDTLVELIAEDADNLLGLSRVGDRFFATYLHDAHSRVVCHALDGTLLGEVALPGPGTVGGFGGRREDQRTWYAFTSFTDPGAQYGYDLATGESTLFWRPELDFDGSRYETEQVFFESRDGTRVPMFITGSRLTERTGDRPVYLYGYGGFNIPLTPGFAVTMVPWLERDALYVVVNLRGGGEYGQTWHDAGRLHAKQNVFDDMIAAAEYLCTEGYTNPGRIAVAGGSNGGLLVGACMTQRPDLFGCALPAVGVMDMLRFQHFTIGWAWVSDYGSADNADDFEVLMSYSPLHSLQPGTAYPATLVTTSDHDDRVVPAHSFKFAAALQAAQGGDAPTLIRIETQAGHGAGKPTAKVIEEAADRLAFALEALGS
ncbi:MAG: S9 family peptidase [Armatimonadetes bacterium]|nr:S9 family peptidase [Armatimonadota bacterium]